MQTIKLIFILTILFLTSTIINAKVKIKERVEIVSPDKNTITTNSSSLPCFSGTINGNSGLQRFKILRDCKIIGTGTLSPANIMAVGLGIDGGYQNDAGITNTTDSIRGRCGYEFECYIWSAWTNCGFSDVVITGSVEGNSISLAITGKWGCMTQTPTPFTATINLVAIPTYDPPSFIRTQAIPNSLDASGYYHNLQTSLYSDLMNGKGEIVSYCGPYIERFTIENPIDGVKLVSFDFDGNRIEGNIIEHNYIDHPNGKVSNQIYLTWDGEKLPNEIDTVRVRTDILGFQAVQPVELKKILPHHFSILLEPEYISIGMSATVYVIAEDMHYNEIQFDDNKMVKLYTTNGGRFIVNTDTVISPTVTYEMAHNGSVKYIASNNVSECVGIEEDYIHVYRPDYPERKGYNFVEITPLCPVINVSKKKIGLSDTCIVTVMGKNADGNIISYPPNYEFSAWMNTDESYGRLRSLNTGEEGTYIVTKQPFEMISADNIDVDSVVVELEVFPEGCADGSINIDNATPTTNKVLFFNSIVAIQADANTTCNQPASVTIEGNSCEYAPQCSGNVQAPLISIQPQKNGFGGKDPCSTNPLKPAGISKIVGIAPFTIEPCFNPSTGKWQFAIPEIKLNAIQDLCPNNYPSGTIIIKSEADLQNLSSSQCQKAKKDFLNQTTYPIKGTYILESVLLTHEYLHIAQYEDIFVRLYREWEKQFNAYQPKCKDFVDVEHARSSANICIGTLVDDFLNRQFYDEFKKKYCDTKAVNPNDPSTYKPAEVARKRIYEENTQKHPIIKLTLDEMINHLPCK